jgi:hypothetical protein
MGLPRAAAIVTTAILALTGCQGPDVGGRCTFQGVNPDQAQADFLETGPVTDCDTLVCMVSPAQTRAGKPNPYCSKPCVSNGDCFQSETGLVCRTVVFDPAFINQLEQQNPQLLQQYLGDIRASSYCAAPLPPAP